MGRLNALRNDEEGRLVVRVEMTPDESWWMPHWGMAIWDHLARQACNQPGLPVPTDKKPVKLEILQTEENHPKLVEVTYA